LYGIKPGLAFDLFTVQRSPFLSNGTKDATFTGSFGLAWYQSDIEIGRRRDEGRLRIKTILLDQIFGFDPDVTLPRPTPSISASGSTIRRISWPAPAGSHSRPRRSTVSTRLVLWR